MNDPIVSLPPRTINIANQEFGRLIALSYQGNRGWFCKCSCGTTKIIASSSLRTGRTRSCGCLEKESRYKHGLSGSNEYRVWMAMIQRCRNPKDKGYKDYGGRGITVCKRWLKFKNFYKDIGSTKPSDKHSIDRIDNDGPYSPENCKWSTESEQKRNNRNTHHITHNGKTMCMTDWADYLNISVDTLSARLNRLGWSTKKALTTPIQRQRKSK